MLCPQLAATLNSPDTWIKVLFWFSNLLYVATRCFNAVCYLQSLLYVRYLHFVHYYTALHSPTSYNVLNYIPHITRLTDIRIVSSTASFVYFHWCFVCLFVSLLIMFSLAARKDIIAETVYVASPSIQSKENGWFEGSCGINWRVDFLSTKTAVIS